MKILKVITLKNKKIKLDLLPEIGGRISSLIFDDFHVLYFLYCCMFVIFGVGGMRLPYY